MIPNYSPTINPRDENGNWYQKVFTEDDVQHQSANSRLVVLYDKPFSQVVSVNSYVESTFHEINPNRSRWSSCWVSAVSGAGRGDTFNGFCEKAKSSYKNDISKFWDDFSLALSQPAFESNVFSKVKFAIETYIDEAGQKNGFATPTFKSLINLSKYINAISVRDVNVYIDYKTGLFGFYVQRRRKQDGILNVIIDEGGVVAFSLVASPTKPGSLVKITGKAKFGMVLEDVYEIKRLFYMLW